MTSDWRLLRRYVEDNSQGAFADLVGRHLALVYSTCLREVGDADLADDVTQAVFLILARKAPSLRAGTVLAGWLFQTARFASQNALTRERRRQRHEQRAVEEMVCEQSQSAWAEIEPCINGVLAELKPGERAVLLLRFFEEHSFAETGQTLGLSEEAARKRVSRALEKVRSLLRKEGVVVSDAALTVLLPAHAVRAVPDGCQANVTTTTTGVMAGHVNLSLIGSRVYQFSEGTLKAMKLAQMKIGVGLAAVALIGFTTYAVAKGTPPVITDAQRGTVSSPLTPAQIVERCRQAYDAIQSYQGTTAVTTESIIGASGTTRQYHASASIRFVRPGKIRVEGTDISGRPFAYVSDGATTAEQNAATKGDWKELQSTKDAQSAERAIASATGIGSSAATTIPTLLLGVQMPGNPFAPAQEFNPEVREDTVDGQPCYLVTTHHRTAKNVTTQSFWIDEKTFLLRRNVSDYDTSAWTVILAGKPLSMPAAKSHVDQRFTNDNLPIPIPESVFTLPTHL